MCLITGVSALWSAGLKTEVEDPARYAVSSACAEFRGNATVLSAR